MNFLIAHWHCVLSAAGLIIAAILLKKKPADKEKTQ
jgi:hypothetical protein